MHAGTQACRVHELEVDPSSFLIAPQTAKGNVVFDALGQSMGLALNTNSGAKVTANFPAQTYGQIEVLARVSVHPSVVTSIDVSTPGPRSSCRGHHKWRVPAHAHSLWPNSQA